MKAVTSGAHYTTVEVDTAEAVKFSFPSTSLSVEASGGDITVALTDTAQAGDDETITVPDGETKMFIHHRMNIDTYYLTGSGTAKLYASNMGDVNPFNGKGKGGDSGGDTTHYRGTTTTPLENGSTTNPITLVKDGESYTYTAVFSDIVIYGYTEFVFDGTTWSEFGRPFDTTPTQGSTNAVTSDGVYRNTAGRKYFVNNVLKGEAFNSSANIASGAAAHAEGDQTTASGMCSHAEGSYTRATAQSAHAEGHITLASGFGAHAEGQNTEASGSCSHASGFHTIANKNYSTVIGEYNVADTGLAHLLIVGNGTAASARSNILEVSETDMNVNGDIKVNNVAIPTPYTTMPTITADMLGNIAMYVGATGNGYTQGCFYIASTDGAAEPTYSWVQIGGGTLGPEEVVLWENEGTTNPDTITLSEAYTNFDEIILYDGGGGRGMSSNIYVQSVLSQNAVIGIIEDTERRIWYQIASPTTLNKADEDTLKNIALHSIVGIKY